MWKRPILVAAFLCLAAAALCRPAAAENSPAKAPEKELAFRWSISDFIAHTPKEAVHYPGGGEDWRVFLKGDTVMVEPRRYSEPPKSVTDIPDFPNDPGAIKVDNGWLVGRNHGEFGGDLKWYSPNGKQTYLISHDHVNGFIRTGGSLFVYEGLDHMSMTSGTIKVVKRDVAGKWIVEPFVTLQDEPCVVLLDTDGAMLVVTMTSVLKVQPSGKIQILVINHFYFYEQDSPVPDLPGTLVLDNHWGYPNSAVLDKDGTLYIGARSEVVKIATISTHPKVEYFPSTTKADEESEAASRKFLDEFASDFKNTDVAVRLKAMQRLPDAPGRYAATQALRPALKDPSPAVRLEAARTAEKLQPNAINYDLDRDLAAAMDDPEEEVAVMATRCLGRAVEGDRASLKKGLKSGRPAVAAECARRLGSWGEKAVEMLPELRDALSDRAPGVRAAANQAILDIVAAADRYVAVLGDAKSGDYDRAMAAERLGHMGPISDWVVPALARALKDPVADVRSNAATALSRIAIPLPKEATDALVQALGDKDSRIADEAGWMLGRIGSSMAPQIVPFLKSENPIARQHAAEALAWMKPPPRETMPDLQPLMGDKVSAVREAAAWALSKMGKDVRPVITELIERLNDPDWQVRRQALHALTRIGPASKEVVPAVIDLLKRSNDDTTPWDALDSLTFMEPRTPEIEAAIIDALASTNVTVQSDSAEAVGKMTPAATKAVPILIKAAEKKVTEPMVVTLGQLGPDAAAAVPVLIKALKNTDGEICLAAAKSLGQIGPAAAPAVAALTEATESRDVRLIFAAHLALKAIQARYRPAPPRSSP